ncbi:MAG TPA: peroxidase-related enzyme [Dyella sp.]|uniref:carboxymuconolactone decarboxylase family protein n=1 Tax=Dyella sp. TaxID=1869338 RepID=UPI002BAA8E4D|nr:peroxidase-related enzyme [Dyella sp.]HTV85462.1 peroxidase-related enzyme [Dyella sp.]
MSRIATPASIDASLAQSKPLLEGVQKQLGVVPNMFRLIGTSPASLEAFMGLFGGLSKGSLPPATRERIALAVAQINGCSYCLSAHTYLGKHVAKLDDAEITANRNGASNDLYADAAVRFAAKVTLNRGQVSQHDLDAVRVAGYEDAQIIEIVLHVALNTLTNYINEVAGTDIDFPVVSAKVA